MKNYIINVKIVFLHTNLTMQMVRAPVLKVNRPKKQDVIPK